MLRSALDNSVRWWPRSCCALDVAAATGQLAAIEWLHIHRAETCTTNAMDNAAANGHLSVVQWLHCHRTEGCTNKAMDGAAAKGHLEVVQWLHRKRSEGCTTDAMDQAAKNEHLDIVEWLWANRPERCTTKALEGAIGNGHLGVACWLMQRFPLDMPANVDVSKSDAGNEFDILLFVHFHFSRVLTPKVVARPKREFSNNYFETTGDRQVVGWLDGNYSRSEAEQQT